MTRPPPREGYIGLGDEVSGLRQLALRRAVCSISSLIRFLVRPKSRLGPIDQLPRHELLAGCRLSSPTKKLSGTCAGEPVLASRRFVVRVSVADGQMRRCRPVRSSMTKAQFIGLSAAFRSAAFDHGACRVGAFGATFGANRPPLYPRVCVREASTPKLQPTKPILNPQLLLLSLLLVGPLSPMRSPLRPRPIKGNQPPSSPRASSMKG
jgi:hypothetical protein